MIRGNLMPRPRRSTLDALLSQVPDILAARNRALMPSGERLHIVPVDAARGGGHALVRQEHRQEHRQERPIIDVGADGSQRQVGRRQVETPGREKYARLSNAGGVCCGLAKVLDSTLSTAVHDPRR